MTDIALLFHFFKTKWKQIIEFQSTGVDNLDGNTSKSHLPLKLIFIIDSCLKYFNLQIKLQMGALDLV